MRIHFGKFVGEEVRQIPSSYLSWVLNNIERLDPDLRSVIIAELKTRRERARQQQQKEGFDKDDEPIVVPGQLANLPALIRTWYREMTLKFHPDRGGSHQAMVAISEAHERLKELVEC
jgi:hypothetical protein